MATNFDPKSSTPHDLPFPLYRMNTPQTTVWHMSEYARNQFAKNLVKKYKGGIGILSFDQLLIAKVDPRGNIQLLPAPHKRFEMWQIANRPELEECPCANFIDLEVEGPWRERGGRYGHHPFCQFDKTAAPVFDRAGKEARSRLSQGHGPQERPDEWLRMREEANGSPIIRSR